jgi:SNF2 family DNA or RNA helicase
MQLHNYQKKMIQHIYDHERCAVFADMGLGKTVTVLEAIANLPKPVLIVGPLRVVQTVWEQEADKWGFDYTFRSITGSKAKRELNAAKDADIHLINVENLVWLRETYAKKWKWKTIVLDESSMFKTSSSKRSRAALWISKQPAVTNIILLSGSPAPNGMQDIFHQMKIIDGGERLGTRKETFLRKYFYKENPYFTHSRWLIQDGKDEVITGLISDVCISLSKEDYLELPDLMVNDLHIDLPVKARGMYEELKKEMFLEISGKKLDPATAGALLGKLCQLASGAVYTEKLGWEKIHDAKLNMLDEIIEESAGQNIIIGYHYQHTLDRLMHKYKNLVTITGNEIVQLWNCGRIPLLALQPASAGHGLNLQGGGHIIVWFDLPWNLEHYMQTNGRLHRQGQDRPVIVHRLIAENTVDENIVNSLEDKASVQEILMRGLL